MVLQPLFQRDLGVTAQAMRFVSFTSLKIFDVIFDNMIEEYLTSIELRLEFFDEFVF